MTTSIQRLMPSHDERQSFLIVAVTAVVWWIAYNRLQPIADFITFQLLRLAPESQI